MAIQTEPQAVSVVVPAYQEAGSIAAALTRLAGVLEATERKYEILVVSDGSTDGTAECAREVNTPWTTVFEYSPNRGKGHALRYGFERAIHPLVAFLDGDLDLDPVVLPGFLERLDADEADVVVGSKVHPDSNVSYPATRRLASGMFRRATRMMLGLDLGDTQTGIKAMRQSVAAPVMHEIRSSGFAFDLELMCWLVERGARIQEAPVVLNFEFTSTLKASSAWEALRDLFLVSSHRRERLRQPVPVLPGIAATTIPVQRIAGREVAEQIAVMS